MSDLGTWLSSLSDHDRFDLFKIVLEKVLLAGIVGLAGAIFAILLERYKSALKKREELTKITLPRIVYMLEQADNLYGCGIASLDNILKEGKPILAWANALCKEIDEISEVERAAMFIKDVEHRIFHSTLGWITVADLIDHTTSSDTIKQELKKPGFLKQPAHYEDTGFINRLITVLQMLPADRVRYAHGLLTMGLIHSVLVPMTLAVREEFGEKVSQFARASMLRLPLENRQQKRAFAAINETIQEMKKTVDDFPKNEIQIEGIPTVSASQFIGTCHAALVTQLRVMLYAA